MSFDFCPYGLDFAKPFPDLKMIGANTKSLPTKFAIKLAEYAGLYVPKEEELGNEELWYDLRDRLVSFQKMALATNYEQSLIAYFDMELTDTQKEILQVIHANTKTWLVGHVAEIMLDNLERMARTNNKDKTELAQLFLDNFVKDNGKQKSKKGLIVQFSNLPENTEIIETEELEDEN